MRILKDLFVAVFLLALTVTALPQDFRTVHDGLEYAEVSKEISGKTVEMDLLRLDLSKVRLDVVHAMDAAIGVETTSSIAARHNALAAVNAGFFRLDNSLYAGVAAGALKIDDAHFGTNHSNRIALFIKNDLNKVPAEETGVSMGRYEDTRWIRLRKEEVELSGLNRQRKENEIIVFTPEFHRTTLTDQHGLEIIVRRNKVVSILDRKGSSLIPENGFVISASGIAREKLLKIVKPGMKAIRGGYIRGKDSFAASTAEDIVGGIPQLIKGGKIDITWELEKTNKAFVETRHPRTAAAILKDGKFLLIVVDGRSEISGGIGLQDLAEYLLSLGAVDAMNLDGGGSTTMWLDGKVMNKPSDKEGERKVSDALIIRKR